MLVQCLCNGSIKILFNIKKKKFSESHIFQWMTEWPLNLLSSVVLILPFPLLNQHSFQTALCRLYSFPRSMFLVHIRLQMMGWGIPTTTTSKHHTICGCLFQWNSPFQPLTTQNQYCVSSRYSQSYLLDFNIRLEKEMRNQAERYSNEWCILSLKSKHAWIQILILPSNMTLK